MVQFHLLRLVIQTMVLLSVVCLKEEVLDEGNCITISPIDGSAFYQETAFLGRGGAGSSILILYNSSMNKYSGLFIARMLTQTCSKYSYGKWEIKKV